MTTTLADTVHHELVIKKSRFICCVQPIASHADGMAVVEQLWQQYPDARHICFAMLVNGQVRQSDDGEPSGTAAKPMLNVLQHKGLDNVLATVVRYFGGIKLGAGGLVRAYSQSVSEALADAELSEVVTLSRATIEVDFAAEALVRRLAEQSELQVEVSYSQQVRVQLSGVASDIESCITQLSNQLRGCLKRLSD